MNIRKLSKNSEYLKAVEDYQSGKFKSARNRIIKLMKNREELDASTMLLSMIDLKQGEFKKAADRVHELIYSIDSNISFNAVLINANLESKKSGRYTAKVLLELFLNEKGPYLTKTKKVELMSNIADYSEVLDAEKILFELKQNYEEDKNTEDAELKREYYNALNKLTKVYEKQGRDEDALENAKLVLEEFPNFYNAGVLYKLASICVRLGKVDKGLEYLSEIDIDSVKNEHFKKAIVEFKESIKSNTSTVSMLTHMFFEECTGEEIEGYILPSLKLGRENGEGDGTSHTRMYPEELSGVNRLMKFKSYASDLKKVIICKGQDAFEGYLMFKYPEDGIVLLEKFLDKNGKEAYGNGTYILPDDIELDYVHMSRTELKAKRDNDGEKIVSLEHYASVYYENLDNIFSDTKEIGVDAALIKYNENRNKNERASKTESKKDSENTKTENELDNNANEIINENEDENKNVDEREKMQEETKTIEEEKKRLAEEAKAIEEEKKRLAEEAKAIEEEKKRLAEEAKTIEEEKKRLAEEAKTIEEEKKKLENEKNKVKEAALGVERNKKAIMENIMTMVSRISEIDNFENEISQVTNTSHEQGDENN